MKRSKLRNLRISTKKRISEDKAYFSDANVEQQDEAMHAIYKRSEKRRKTRKIQTQQKMISEHANVNDHD